MKVFGGLMGDSHNTTTQSYKYIGKELDRTHGLDWYDHGARHYAPVTGRWNAVDALAEKDYAWSHDERASIADGFFLKRNGRTTCSCNRKGQGYSWLLL